LERRKWNLSHVFVQEIILGCISFGDSRPKPLGFNNVILGIFSSILVSCRIFVYDLQVQNIWLLIAQETKINCTINSILMFDFSQHRLATHKNMRNNIKFLSPWMQRDIMQFGKISARLERNVKEKWTAAESKRKRDVSCQLEFSGENLVQIFCINFSTTSTRKSINV
jgi:hypothetical protein